MNSKYSYQSSYKISPQQDNFDLLAKFTQKRYFWYKAEKNEHHYWILHIQINWSTKFQLKIAILRCWTKFAKKRSFWSKAEKVRIPITICIFLSPSVRTFSLKLQLPFLGKNSPKKGISSRKRKKWTWLLNSAYSNYWKYEISAWNNNFDFLEQICPKKLFPV